MQLNTERNLHGLPLKAKYLCYIHTDLFFRIQLLAGEQFATYSNILDQHPCSPILK